MSAGGISSNRTKILFFLLTAVFAASSAVASVTKDIHLVPFYIHEDLIDVPAGRDLAYFQAVIDEAIADANVLLQGKQGPDDDPCSAELVATGTPGATLILFSGADASPALPRTELSSVDFANDSASLISVTVGDFGGGSGVFLVDFIERCGIGPFPDPSDLPIGCASAPNCTGNPNDDPNLIAVLTLETIEIGALASTLAHERGHNACLIHGETVDQCEVMRPGMGGGCLTPSQCENYRDGRTACLVVQSGSECEVAPLSEINANDCVEAELCANAEGLLAGGDASAQCHADANTIEADGSSCIDFGVSGFCSGGTCDSEGSETDASLVMSADTNLIAYPVDGTTGQQVVDARLTMSAKPGAWTDEGSFDGSEKPEGFAYAPERGLVYGVVGTDGSDKLIRIDPRTGSTLSSTTIFGRHDIIALAWDPTRELLLGLETENGFEDLIEVDPDDGSSSLVGGIQFGCSSTVGGDNFRGLAFDPVNDLLFTSSFCGLFLVDCSNPAGNGGLCPMTALGDENRETSVLARAGSGLAYSADTGNIYMIGNQIGFTSTQAPPATGTFRTTLYNVIRGGTVTVDDTVSVRESIGIKGITIGGLAAVPTPEPGALSMAAVSLASVLALAWIRRLRG